MKEKLQDFVEKRVLSGKFKFFNTNNVAAPRVLNGDNVLNSCFQFKLVDADGIKFMNIKIYDKVLDLIGRDNI